MTKSKRTKSLIPESITRVISHIYAIQAHESQPQVLCVYLGHEKIASGSNPAWWMTPSQVSSMVITQYPGLFHLKRTHVHY